MLKTRKPIVLSVCAVTAIALTGLIASAQTPAQTPPIAPLPTKPVSTPPTHAPVPAQQQPVDPASIVVKVDPSVIDFGEIPTGDVGARMVKLINTADRPMTIVTHRVTCGCTALDLAPNTVLGPKEVKEVKVQLNGGATPGPLAGKKVTFVIEGQPEVEVTLSAMAVSFVTQEPASLSPDANADGKVTLKSRDGTKFRILSMQPPLITEFPQEPAAEHVVQIDWAKYREMGISRKTVFYFDHPKCQNLMAKIEFPPDWIQEAQQKMRAQAPVTNPPAVVTPTDPNLLLPRSRSSRVRMTRSSSGLLPATWMSIHATAKAWPFSAMRPRPPTLILYGRC